VGRIGERPGDFVRGLDTTAGRFSIIRFGGPTQFKTSTISVGTSPTKIVGNNPRRVRVTLYNRSLNNIDVDYVATVSAGGGVPLTASSGVIEASIDDDGEAVISELYGIASAASSSVFVVEVIRV